MAPPHVRNRMGSGQDEDCELEFDLERLINDTLTCGVSGESPSLLPAPAPHKELDHAHHLPVGAHRGQMPQEAQHHDTHDGPGGDMSVRINNYERLFACAEHLASVKKSLDEITKEHQEDELVQPAAWQARQQKIQELQHTVSSIYFQMAEELGISVPSIEPGHDSTDQLLTLLQRFIPRDQLGNLLSIGSIPHFCGEACVGPCRFHRKGKCFDGPLCRFCHCPGEHVGAVKKISKKSRKAKKSPKKDGMPGDKANSTTALAALFAALDVSNDQDQRAYYPPCVMGPGGAPVGGYGAQQQDFVPFNWANSHVPPIY